MVLLFSVAIDGPSGAGKSSIARAAAKELGFIYVDTGALYRTIALYMLQNGVNLACEGEVEAALQFISVELRFVRQEQRVFLNGIDVSEQIRTAAVAKAASHVSAIPSVRSSLLTLQRSFAEKSDLIMDGRDIGTVVLPQAQLKIYLTATPQCRAKRRYLQLLEKGEPAVLEQVLADIEKRDYNDSHRAIAPLREAEDAVRLDTSNMTFDEAVSAVIRLIRSRYAEHS